MVNYANGKVYKIEPTVEHEEGDVYYGSTTKQYLSQRFDEHRSKFKKMNLSCSSKILFEKYGVNNCVIVLLELVDAKTNDELKAVEAKYILKNACVNKQVPLRTKQQYQIDNADVIREKIKQYQIDNAGKINEYQKQYQIDNAEQIKETKKEYNIKNADVIREQKKQYRIENPDIMKNFLIENAEKLKAYREQYRINNSDKIKEKAQQYRIDNRNTFNENQRQKRLLKKEQANAEN